MSVDDAYVKSQLEFEGADGSTTFTDESGKTWTAHGGAAIDTADFAVGSASGLFNGSTDYVDTPDHADFSLANTDWTIDFYFKCANSGSGYLFSQIASSGLSTTRSIGIQVNTYLTVAIGIASPHNTISFVSTRSFSLNVWHKAELCSVLNGTTTRLYMYVDNAYVGGGTYDGTQVINSTAKPTIGREGEYASGNYYNGWVDKFRLSIGIARRRGYGGNKLLIM